MTGFNMTMAEKAQAIRTAFAALGINAKGKTVSIENNHDSIGTVLINKEYFGMFDFMHETFVD